MPKKINPQVRGRCGWLVSEHRAEYSSMTESVQAVARQLGGG